jgi:hypothetical protein
VSANGLAYSTPHPVLALLAGTLRRPRCLLAPPGTDLGKLRQRVWVAEFGPVPVGMIVAPGRCGRGDRCTNPWHLKLKRERLPDGRVAYCRRGHPLFNANAYEPPNGGRRVCRTCALEQQRRRAGRTHLLTGRDPLG